MTPACLLAIEDALREVGDWGTVELVVERGRITFIGLKKSIKLVDGRQVELPMT